MNNSLLQTLMNLFTIFYLPRCARISHSAFWPEMLLASEQNVLVSTSAFQLAEKLFVAIFPRKTYLRAR
jgi:hypothetical protein